MHETVGGLLHSTGFTVGNEMSGGGQHEGSFVVIIVVVIDEGQL